MEDKYVVIWTAAGLFIGGYGGGTGGKSAYLKDPLSLGEQLQQDPKTGQILGAIAMMKPPLMSLDVPESQEFNYISMLKLNHANANDNKLIMQYEDQLKSYKYAEAGIVAPSNEDVIKITR